MEQANILIIESDQAMGDAWSHALNVAGYESQSLNITASTPETIIDVNPDLLIYDSISATPSALEICESVQNQCPKVKVVFTTNQKALCEELKEITPCLLKPIDPDHLVDFVKETLNHDSSTNANLPVASDPYSKHILKLAKQVAPSDVSVLISGESGVGKEVIARFIHDNSNRSGGDFVAINCAAIPDNMLEASLFGYEKGAFTGAVKAYPGKFEQAQNGTLLLDEISEMPLALQAKLLRVLQEKEVERLGGSKTIPLNVRIIATTNRNLQEEVINGNFRQDLYYRINIFPVHWIPLRDRSLDILPLAEYLLTRHASLMQRPIPSFSDGAKYLLTSHNWPGNAREMDNVIQRALILQSGDKIEMHDIQIDKHISSNVQNSTPQQSEFMQLQPVPENPTSRTGLKQQEYQLILQTLQQTNGNRTNAAEILSISPRTLRYKLGKMREAGMKIPTAKKSDSYSD